MNLWRQLLKALRYPEAIGLAALVVLPWLIPQVYGGQLTEILIFGIVALGLNVVLGSTGILHLGIAAFFGIGAYVAGVLMAPAFPFQTGFTAAVGMATVAAALAGVLLGIPTLRLRGDYLALVTLGFGEVVRFSLRNFEEITGGTQSLLLQPTWFGAKLGAATDYRPLYFLCLFFLVAVVFMLRNLENSRLGRAWNALREDELAATCMGVNAARAKLAALAVGSGLAGLAGCLFVTNLQNTSVPDAYNFNRSVTIMCCVILGGMGSIRGTLLGVLILMGYDTILSPLLDDWIPAGGIFKSSKLMVFGLVLILIVRFRPEGLLPSKRIAAEYHTEYRSDDSILSETTMFR